MKQILLLVVVGLLVAAAFTGPRAAPPIEPEIGHKLHVLFTTDSSQPLTQDQTNELASAAVLEYLDSHCTKDSGHAGWRHYDVSMSPADLENESKYWRDLWPKHGEPPSVLIDASGKPVSSPLPADSAHLLDLLKKYGGK